MVLGDEWMNECCFRFIKVIGKKKMKISCIENSPIWSILFYFAAGKCSIYYVWLHTPSIRIHIIVKIWLPERKLC